MPLDFADLLRQLVAWSVLLILPGYVIVRRALPHRIDRLGMLAASFGVGYLVWTPVAFLAYLCRIPLDVVTGAAVIVSLAVGLWHWRSTPCPPLESPLPRRELALLLSAAAVFCVCAWLSLSFQDPSSDSTFHLAFIRRLLSFGVVTLEIHDHTRPLSWESPSESWVNSVTYAYNAWYVLVAAVARASATDPVQVWLFFPALFVSIVLSGFWLIGRYLFDSAAAASGSVLAVVILWLGGSTARGGAYPNHLVYVILLVGTWLILQFAVESRRPAAALSVLLIPAMLLLHPIGAVHMVVIAAGCAAGCLASRDLRTVGWRTVLLLAAMLTTSIPFLIAKLSFQGGLSLDVGAAGTRHQLELTETLYVFDPRPALVSLPLCWLALLLFSRFLREQRRGPSIGGAVITGVVASILIFIFNPVLYPLVSEHLSVAAARRLAQPMLMITAPLMVGARIPRWLQAAGLPNRAAASARSPAAVLAAVAAVVALAGHFWAPATRRADTNAVRMSIGRLDLPARRGSDGEVTLDLGHIVRRGLQSTLLRAVTFNPAFARHDDLNYCAGRSVPCLHGLLDAPALLTLVRSIPPGAVLASDRATSLMIGTLHDITPVALYHNLSRDERRRSDDLAALFAPAADTRDVRAILDRYGVEYVLVGPSQHLAGEALRRNRLVEPAGSAHGYHLYRRSADRHDHSPSATPDAGVPATRSNSTWQATGG